MPQNNQTLLEKTVADQWQTLPSGLTVICLLYTSPSPRDA